MIYWVHLAMALMQIKVGNGNQNHECIDKKYIQGPLI